METVEKVLNIINDEFFGHPSRKDEDDIKKLQDIVLLLAEEIDNIKTQSR